MLSFRLRTFSNLASLFLFYIYFLFSILFPIGKRPQSTQLDIYLKIFLCSFGRFLLFVLVSLLLLLVRLCLRLLGLGLLCSRLFLLGLGCVLLLLCCFRCQLVFVICLLVCVRRLCEGLLLVHLGYIMFFRLLFSKVL